MPRTLISLVSLACAALLFCFAIGAPAAAQNVPQTQLQACQQAISGYIADVRRADEKFRQNPGLYESLGRPGVFDSREGLFRQILGGLILSRAQQLYGRNFASLQTYDAYISALKQSAPTQLQPVSLWVLSDLRGALVANGYSEDEADYMILRVYESTDSYECGGARF